jgi:PKD repeat protein
MFGFDGALYAGAGDGASFLFADYGQNGNPLNPLGDPPVGIGGVQTPPTAEGGATRAQSLRRVSGPAVLNGTLIRVDPFTGAGLSNNPLFSSADPNARRIVGYGFRNPFRFTFRPGTSELWIGDVGWNEWEEIDRITNVLNPTVSNFGWPCYEGPAAQASYQALGLNICQNLYASGSAAPPYFTYSHSQQVVGGETCPTGSSAIAGLAFNQGGTYPATYQGALFFADNSRDCIWSMLADSNGVPDPANIQTFVAGAANPVDLQIGPGGDLFYVDFDGGTIRRIQFTSGNQAPNAVIQATPLSGPAPLTVTFSSVGSSDPDGDPITYSWNFGDGGTSTQANPSHTYGSTGTFIAVLTVTDSKGAFSKAQVSITSGNSKPTASIDAPVAGTLWRVGQSITFSGHATDPQDGALPPSAFFWEIILHHCPSNCHTHPNGSFPGVTTASFSAPDHDYPSYLEIKLTATDAGGLTDTKSLRLDPQTVALTFQSDPSGLHLAVGSSSSLTPFTRTVILGSANSVSAGTPQALGGTNYKFVSWSDGGNQSHIITGTAAATYTATYEVTTDPIPSPPPPSGDGGGGGCTLDKLGTGDALLPALFLVILGLLLMRIKRRANKADRTSV